MKFPEENIGEYLHDIEYDNEFLDVTAKARATKAKQTNGLTSDLKAFVHQKIQSPDGQ